MEEKLFIDSCHIFFNTTNCPVCLFQDGMEILRLPGHSFPFPQYHHKALRGTNRGIECIISESSLSYAYIQCNSSDFAALIGPYATHAFTNHDILNIMKEYSLPKSQISEVTDFFMGIGTGMYGHIYNLIELMYFLMNRERIDVRKFLGENEAGHKRQITRRYSEALAESKEIQIFHNTYQLEQLLYKKITDGDINYFLKNIPDSPDLHVGRIADNNLRQEKNIFIVAVTLATRAAISGGLSIEEAYQLSDEYIQSVERMIDIDAINRLHNTMVIDFTERVKACKVPVGISKEIHESIQYIQLHTNSDISVQDVAEAVGISRSYLSKKFKAELGFDVSSFIMRCKLEEAKSLLAFSDKSIAEISSYLCFSSQSYFTNVFKGKYSITPKEYRNKRNIE